MGAVGDTHETERAACGRAGQHGGPNPVRRPPEVQAAGCEFGSAGHEQFRKDLVYQQEIDPVVPKLSLALELCSNEILQNSRWILPHHPAPWVSPWGCHTTGALKQFENHCHRPLESFKAKAWVFL